MNHGQKNYLECIEMQRNDSKFTIAKYPINTMEIIKLSQVNVFMPVTKFPHLTIWLFCKRRPFQIFVQFRELFKETNNKNWGLCIEKERERKKHKWLSGHKSERELILNFKIFKYE